MRPITAMGVLLILCLTTVSVAGTITRTSNVTTVVTAMPGDYYEYEYTVWNTSPAGQFSDEGKQIWPLIVEYEIPLANPADIWGVKSPEWWAYEILTAAEYLVKFGEANPFGAPFVLHWYDTDPPEFGTEEPEPEDEPEPEPEPNGNKAIAPADFPIGPNFLQVYLLKTDGFVLYSQRSPVDGPYLTSWVDEFRNIGDPPLPGGGLIGGMLPFQPSGATVPVPAPGALTLLGLGLLGLIGVVRRRRTD